MTYYDDAFQNIDPFIYYNTTHDKLYYSETIYYHQCRVR